jgi:polar amino acid transport system permease protein
MLGSQRDGRRSRLLGGGSSTGRYVAVATASTVVFFVVLAVLIVNSPGWPTVKSSFFSIDEFRAWWRTILSAFWLNVQIFCECEVAILILALGIAVLRSLREAVFFPLRLIAIMYVDLFRGVPTILVIYLLAFGIPALQLTGVPTSALLWAKVGLVLVYTAYVSEVYRAGIESVHPSQEAAARSLGLSRFRTLRHVIVPQAVRRVVPPLLNDFIGLQKDTALVGLVGPVEAFRQSQIASDADFNFTPYVIAAILFIAITIPLARFTDWLIERERRRRQAGGVA